MKRKDVLIGLAVVAVIAIGSTAIADSGWKGPASKSAKGKRGPRGPAGLAGATGPPGATGATGPSSARELTALTGTTVDLVNATTIGTMTNVAPGAYAINAKVRLGLQTANTGLVSCMLATGDGAQDGASGANASMGFGGGQTSVATLPMTMTRTFSATGSIAVTCDEAFETADGAVAGSLNIVAVKLGSESNP